MNATSTFFLGPFWKKIIDELYDYLKDQFRWQAGMKEELERLRNNHPKIQAVVSIANQEDIIDKNPALKRWIWQLRDAIDEADDLLDDFEYMRHAEQLVSNTEEETNMLPFKSFILPALDNLRKFGERALHVDPLLKRLVEVVQKLDKVSAEFTTFLHLIDGAQLEEQKQLDKLHKNRETGSFPSDVLIGRKDDKEFVLEWLKLSNEEQTPSNEEHQTHVSGTNLYKNISLLSIVGDGGMGKTTLLQHVYKDEIAKKFDVKMWVCVSNNFDVRKVIGAMLESHTRKSHPLESLDALQSKLESEVNSKKFLLVLDDIWEKDDGDKSELEKVIAPLAGGGLGSKILITTRMDSVASIIANVINKKKEVRRLDGLKEDECLNILTTHAFAGVESPDDHKKLRYIAKKLVKKLSGSPLAAKIIGGVLKFDLDERHWRKVLNNVLNQNGIFSILKLSYISLPKHLQNCFSFCSIFSQDYEFHKVDLVRMWIAVGFIQPSNIQEETLEDIGERYFDILVNKSFFDKVTTYNKSYYKMHDLLHDLAQFVSKQECFRDVGDEELLLRIPQTIRHLSIKLSSLKVLGKRGIFKNLRTLRITYDETYQDYVDTIFNEIFKVTRSIRLLELQSEWLHDIPKVIPEAIEYLKHLRFLRYNFFVTQLPRSLTKLYHMQFIICWYYNKDFFPNDMNNLSNLRYVSRSLLRFSGIGKLKLLQKLDFYVEKEIGYRIEELKHMNDLCVLKINHLESTREATEACNAKLCYKKKLTNLCLNWTSSVYNRRNIVNCDLDAEVFDNLQPYKYLKRLHMNYYMGVRSAIWMNEARLINNLEEINLRNCLEWQILPPFGQLPFLKILILNNMPKVKRLDKKNYVNGKYCEFESLEKLHFLNLEALEDWFDARADCLFPRLTELQLYKCPNLQELPYLPPKLETLKIVNIGWKTLNRCSISTVSLDNNKYCNFPSSKMLQISRLEALENWFGERLDCVFPHLIERSLANLNAPKPLSLKMKNIGLKTLNGTFTTLRDVEIINCPNLITLKESKQVETIPNCQLMLEYVVINDPSVLHIELLRNVLSIGKLTVRNNDKLVSFSSEAEQWFLQGSSSVDMMFFRSLSSLQFLPSSLTRFSSLGILEVEDLPQLQELPDLPASLSYLNLTNLKSLQRLPSSLSTIYSLNNLHLERIPLLKSLLDLPPSLCELHLESLDNLECLPSCLPNLSSLIYLHINKVPLLQELPNLPPSLTNLIIIECHPNLEKGYHQFEREQVRTI